MYQYIAISPTKLSNDSIKRIDDGACIPFDEGNIDYQNYLKWLDGYENINGLWVKTSEGNTPISPFKS